MESFFTALVQAPIQTIIVVGGIILLLLAFVHKAGEMEVSSRPSLPALSLGLILLIVGGSWVYSSSRSKNPDLPFDVTIYNFEKPADETNITPWFAVPHAKSYKAMASKDYAHSGKYSLREIVDMQSAATNPNTEYAGIGITQDIPLNTKAIICWIYIPKSEPIQDIIFKAHILTYFKNDSGVTNTVMGETKQINLGVWTPLFIGTFQDANFDSNPVAWKGKIDEMYLTVWSDKAYTGSMYFDDCSIYK